MYNWRNKGERSYQEHPRMKSAYYNAKPPLGGNPNWLPSWEKEFVTEVGAMSWRKFLEGKRYVHLDNKIMNWDDLAGKEAFNTSKDNFHAKVSGLPYIKPHNPDLYIDKIDWDAKIDHDLYQDFDSDSIPPDSDSDREPVLIFGDALPDPLKNYSPFGWGDEDETAVCQNKNGFNYDDYVNKWDVDVEALAQWYSHQNDEKAHEDQGWNDDKKNNWGSDNNNYGNVNNQNDNKAHGDQGWNDDETNNWGSNNNNYYGNVNNPNDNEAPGNQGWIDVKKNNWGSNNNNYYGNVNNQNDDEAPGDQGWIDVKKNNWGSNNNNYYGNVNNGGGRYKNWRCNGNNNNNNNYWRNNGNNNNKNEAGRNNGNKNKNEAWRNNGNRRKQVGQAHGSQWVNQVHQ